MGGDGRTAGAVGRARARRRGTPTRRRRRPDSRPPAGARHRPCRVHGRGAVRRARARGLPVDVGVAEAIVAGIVGPRPRSAAEADAQRDERDAAVLRHAPPGRTDLRNPAQVRSLLRRVGVEVSDTRAWRLEQLRDAHPLVDALLTWRRIERTATTYGYGWLDEHVRDGRLRGVVDGVGRRRRADDGERRAAQHARRPAARRRRRGRARVRPRRPRPDRAAGPRRGLRRPRPRRGDADRRHVRAGGGTARRRPGDGQGRRARCDVRPDDGPRRAGPAPSRRRVPGGDALPPRRRRGRSGRADHPHVRRPADPLRVDERRTT